MSNTEKIMTGDLKMRYCEKLRELGAVGRAALAIGVDRTTVRRCRNRDEAFDTLCHSALADFADDLEKEAYRRAVDGWEEEKMSANGTSYTVRKFDTALLSMLLKAKKPDEYSDKVKIEGTVKHDHEHTARIDLQNLSTAQSAALRLLLGNAGSDETVKDHRKIEIDHRPES